MKKYGFIGIILSLILFGCGVFGKKSDHKNGITEKHWKLKTLDGKSVRMGDRQEREVYFRLRSDKNRVEGFGGCNSFTGEYKLTDEQKIEFSRIGSTLKACPDVPFDEAKFLKTLHAAERYEIDEDKLKLKSAEGKTLATFKAVYFD